MKVYGILSRLLPLCALLVLLAATEPLHASGSFLYAGQEALYARPDTSAVYVVPDSAESVPDSELDPVPHSELEPEPKSDLEQRPELDLEFDSVSEAEPDQKPKSDHKKPKSDQEQEQGPEPEQKLKLKEAKVTASRDTRGVGSAVTVFATPALRENISVSLSDLLAYNSSVFVKQSGRASLSTVSFRGTSSSHTQVLWNGMKINSPMLGMTDFSMIPSFLTDNASLLHGPASLAEASGGLGGAVSLKTGARSDDGWGLEYVQGFGSFLTADEYLKVSYGGRRFSSSTRAVVSSSRNDFRYVNKDKNENVYDSQMNIIGTYHPVERNRNGAWLDMHLLQDFRYDAGRAGSFVLSAWYLRSRREQPPLTVDYGMPADFINEQRENTFRTVLTWTAPVREKSSASVSAGYVRTALDYDYARDGGSGEMTWMNKSRSRTNTVFLKGKYAVRLGEQWHLKAGLTLNRHFVDSRDEAKLSSGTKLSSDAKLSFGNTDMSGAKLSSGDTDMSGTYPGYRASRTELSLYLAAEWHPFPRAGISLSLREELYGRAFSPVIPALSAEYLVSEKGNLRLMASVSRNYRYPTLNDWYFRPGGNPDLKPECGFCYDAGYSFSLTFFEDRVSLSGEGSWFDSYIDDWILWLPAGSAKNFYTPVNLKKVHAYGVEQSLSFGWSFADAWTLAAAGNFTWSPSINCGEQMNRWDESVGKQLVYIPEYSSSVSASLSWRSWKLLYKWCWYSDRFTMSSNDYTISGFIPDYFMSDVTLSKNFSFTWAGITVSLAVKNLFDEDYVTVLSRPMPGINFEAFVGITPKFGRR